VTLRNLVIATYYFRCHMEGHDDLKRTFDAVSDDSPSIMFRFPTKADSK